MDAWAAAHVIILDSEVNHTKTLLSLRGQVSFPEILTKCNYQLYIGKSYYAVPFMKIVIYNNKQTGLLKILPVNVFNFI